MKNNYPVVFFVFKRPATTLQFLEHMKKADIKKIYIFSDGPRNSAEKFEIEAVRDNIEIFHKSYPDIQIMLHSSNINLGLKRNIVNGLNHVFSKEDAAIILEDDCLPTLDFFRFASEMLDRYKNNLKVMSVNGTSSGGISEFSYDFTKYAQCWGWATWARAWKLYDPTLRGFSNNSWKMLGEKLKMGWLMRWYWGTMLQVVKADRINTWDFQWSYTHFLHKGLAITPSTNLIKNIGFDNVATNTKTKSGSAAMSTKNLIFPLLHPKLVVENMSVSRRIESTFYANPVAILGLLRQYIYWKWSIYANRH